MSNNPTADQWLNNNAGASYPAVAFERVGYIIKGKVAEPPRIVTTQAMNGQGDEESYVVAVDVLEGTQVLAGKSGERTPAQVGQRVSIWFRRGAILNALSGAVSKAGATGVAVGGLLAVRRDADGQGKPGMTPPHMFTVQYVAPAQEVPLLGGAGADPFPPSYPTGNGDPFATAQPAPTPDPFATAQPAAAPSDGGLF